MQDYGRRKISHALYRPTHLRYNAGMKIIQVDKESVASQIIDYLRLKGPGFAQGYRCTKVGEKCFDVTYQHKVKELSESECFLASQLADAWITGYEAYPVESVGTLLCK